MGNEKISNNLVKKEVNKVILEVRIKDYESLY